MGVTAGVTAGPVRGTHAGPGRVQTLTVLAVTVLLLTGVTWFLTDGFNDGVTSVTIAGELGVDPPTVGRPPVAFSGLGYDGQPVMLAAYAGKPLWLTFGASWCRDCRAEAPDLEATYEQDRSKGLNDLAEFINDPAADISAYAKRAGLSFPIVADVQSKIAGAYRILGIPTHIFIGADGLIKEVKIGALSKDDMIRAVSAIVP